MPLQRRALNLLSVNIVSNSSETLPMIISAHHALGLNFDFGSFTNNSFRKAQLTTKSQQKQVEKVVKEDAKPAVQQYIVF